ncbi:AGE family epimerase/isomerase [Rhodocaloribacter litoris]|uniref:AGE family epimerase/isomerase n=1 Tax=Rhodocaloribacter litoris TaxID=2558931 RepID=UPI001423D579|nr:AGE family epimerase/isomerase [Rhodocaloribacter litoris]QXD15448.1 AGE family epimerase/isomerase [Rhodocaloribacter litoris]
MEAPPLLHRLRDELYRELVDHILPYWMTHAVDHTGGGFVGRITNENEVLTGAPKGCVLNARILWAFSAAYRLLRNPDYRALADRAYDYVSTCFLDTEHGGVYWMLNPAGRPRDTRKFVYAQAFAIYGLSEYARATGHEPARALAVELGQVLEHHCTDPVHGGYFEVFSRDWRRLAGARLSDRDEQAPKSMNTHLHVLEAYTSLYRIWPAPGLRRRLAGLIDLFLTKILDTGTGHVRPFFQVDWTPTSRVVSFGHDIEASWLLMEAAGVLGEAALKDRARTAGLAVARTILAEGVDRDGGLFYEAHPDGTLDTDKHWWPQAEAIVGFVNAYGETGERLFLDAAAATWAFTRAHIVDRVHGEWFFRVDRRGNPCPGEDKVGVWKCPYHNVRACLEVIARTDRLARQALREGGRATHAGPCSDRDAG